MSSRPENPFLASDVETALGRRYIVGYELGVGGQGAVFKATRTARPDGEQVLDIVALKLHLYLNQDVRVEREIQAAENISHPALARMIEDGYCDVANRRTHYIAWEFIEGETLAKRLRNGPLLEYDVLEIGRHVAAAIAAIWSRHIVHGDIKPSNIMLREDGGAVLIDLGAARYLDQDNSPAARKPIGTPGYFSPEQARGEKRLSCASDVFSLGVVMLQSLLGRHPTNYHQSTLSEGIRASGGKLAASTGLLSALDKMLSPKPAFRPSPVGLSDYFHRLQETIQEEFATRARPGHKTGDTSR